MGALTKVMDAVLQRVLIALMLFLVGAVLWQVISRYALGSPSSWTEESARFLLIWISLLGAAFAFRSGMHLALDILPGKVSAETGAWLRRLTLLLIIAFSAAVLVVGGGGLVQLTWELKQYSAVLGLPMAFVYLVIPVTGTLICLYSLAAFDDPGIGSAGHSVTEGE